MGKKSKFRYVLYGILGLVAIIGIIVLVLRNKKSGREIVIEYPDNARFGNAETVDIAFTPDFTRCGDGVLLINRHDDEPEGKDPYLISWTFMDKEGNLKETVDYPLKDGIQFIYRVECIDDSKVFILERMKDDSFYLEGASLDGKQIFDVRIETQPNVRYVGRSAILPDGSVLLTGYDITHRFDSNGKLIKEAKVPGVIDNLDYLMPLGQNGIILGRGISGESFVSCLDTETMKYSKPVRVEMSAKRPFYMEGYDFCVFGPRGIVGYLTEESRGVQFLNFEESGIVGGNVRSMMMLDADTAIICELSGNVAVTDEVGTLSIYHRLAPGEGPEKKVVTLGGIYIPEDMEKYVGKFNKESSEYRIRVVNYGDLYGEKAEDQYRYDLLSGNVPDIILTSSLDDPYMYMNKNVFEDLYPLMEKSGIRKEDYLSNVLSAGSMGGKLYLFIPKFSVEGVGIVREDHLGEKEGLSVSALRELEKKYSVEGSGIFMESRESILTKSIMYTGKDFFDVQKGICDFESDGYEELLEWTGEYDSTERVRALMGDATFDYPAIYRMNKSFFEPINLNGFQSFNRIDQRDFGGMGVLVGFPNEKGDCKGVIRPVYSLALSTQCADKESAFAFIRYFMEEEYQTDTESPYTGNNFPSKESAFAALAKEATKKNEKDVMVNSLGELVPVEPMTSEKLQRVEEFVRSTDQLLCKDEAITNLLLEEADLFYKGQWTAGEAARMTQNRLQIYIEEQR